MSNSKKFLFVCVENAGRSQMAQAFFKKYVPNFQAESAGTQPTSKIHPIVVEVMNEIGINMDEQKPKIISSEMLDGSIAINMGCMDKESCPALFLKDTIDWNIADPKDKTIEEVRIIRDSIDSKVKELVENLQEQK